MQLVYLVFALVAVGSAAPWNSGYPVGVICRATLQVYNGSNYASAALSLTTGELLWNAPSLLWEGNNSYSFTVWTYVSGFGVLSKLKNEKLDGMTLDNISDALPLSVVGTLPYGPVFAGDVYFVTTNRPSLHSSNFVFKVLQINPTDGSVTIEFGIFNVLVFSRDGATKIAFAEMRNPLVRGDEQSCATVEYRVTS